MGCDVFTKCSSPDPHWILFVSSICLQKKKETSQTCQYYSRVQECKQ